MNNHHLLLPRSLLRVYCNTSHNRGWALPLVVEWRVSKNMSFSVPLIGTCYCDKRHSLCRSYMGKMTLFILTVSLLHNKIPLEIITDLYSEQN